MLHTNEITREFSFGYSFPQIQEDVLDLSIRSDEIIGHLLSLSDQFDTGVMVFDKNCETVGLNGVCTRLIAEGDGLRQNGRNITAASKEDSMRLNEAICSIIDNCNTDGFHKQSARMVAIQRCGRSALTAGVVPLSFVTGIASGITGAVLYITDPECGSEDSVRAVCELYGLTVSETRVILYLVEGFTTGDIALAMDLKEETVRTYLKHCYSKTNTSRQSELVQLILRSRLMVKLPQRHDTLSKTSK